MAESTFNTNSSPLEYADLSYTDVNLISGGVARVGNMVTINMRLVPTTTISTGAHTIVSGLPTTSANRVAFATNNEKVTAILVSGGIYINNTVALTTSDVLIVSGTYITP